MYNNNAHIRKITIADVDLTTAVRFTFQVFMVDRDLFGNNRGNLRV